MSPSAKEPFLTHAFLKFLLFIELMAFPEISWSFLETSPDATFDKFSKDKFKPQIVNFLFQSLLDDLEYQCILIALTTRIDV